MTYDEIIKLAGEVGLTDKDLGDGMTDYGDSSAEIVRFAELVAANERDACAKVCDVMGNVLRIEYKGSAANHCAAAIRARVPFGWSAA